MPLCPVVRSCSSFWETAKLSFRVTVPLYIPSAVSEVCYSYTPSPAFDIVTYNRTNHSNRFVVLSHCCFICSSLMTEVAEHLWACLFAICISSMVRWWFNFVVHFFIGLFFIEEFLFILNITILSDTYFQRLFSQPVTCFPLNSVFDKAVFNFSEI